MELIAHLANVHHIQNVSQLLHLTAACQKPTQNFVQGYCLLCDYWKPSAHMGENTNNFRRHLRHHLGQLALSALLQFIYGLELLDDELTKLIALKDEAQSYTSHRTANNIPSIEPTVNELDVQLMETRNRVVGKEHPDTLTSMGNLAFTFEAKTAIKRLFCFWKNYFSLEVRVLDLCILTYCPHLKFRRSSRRA